MRMIAFEIVFGVLSNKFRIRSGLPIATAAQVNDSPRHNSEKFAPHRLGCGYGLGLQQHANLAAEKIKKYPNPLTI
jgi:hypothetical protein